MEITSPRWSPWPACRRCSVAVDCGNISSVFRVKGANPQGLCVFFPGADEQDLPGDSEAGPDGWGVLPQTEAGQHGGVAHQHTRAGSHGHKAGQSRGKERQQNLGLLSLSAQRAGEASVSDLEGTMSPRSLCENLYLNWKLIILSKQSWAETGSLQKPGHLLMKSHFTLTHRLLEALHHIQGFTLISLIHIWSWSEPSRAMVWSVLVLFGSRSGPFVIQVWSWSDQDIILVWSSSDPGLGLIMVRSMFGPELDLIRYSSGPGLIQVWARSVPDLVLIWSSTSLVCEEWKFTWILVVL